MKNKTVREPVVEGREYRITFALEAEEAALMDRLMASYGELKPSMSQVVRMLTIGALYHEARAKKWIAPGPVVKE